MDVKNEKVDIIKLRKGRRMFCIHNDKLYVAESDLACSHAEWFKKMGWDSARLMDEIPRGMIKDNGDVYFYIGGDFRINEEIESIFIPFIKELFKKLNLDQDAKIYGGLINTGPDTIWPPAKDYGVVADYL